MSQYLGILRRYIREFVVNSSYRTLAELQTNARRKEVELETQTSEEKEIHVRDRRPMQSHRGTKRSKPADSRAEGQKIRTCGKCVKGHKGPCRSGTACYIYGNEGH